MKLLHIVATPRDARSNTLPLAMSFIDALKARHSDLEVDEVDLFHQDLPAVAGVNIDVKYTLMRGGPVDKDHAESWARIEALIENFVAADAYVITTPMWNFSIPYALKYYLDCLVQPGYVFRYNEQGYPVPLVHGKKLLCITSRGSDYGPESPMHALDFQEPYLRAIFGFIGVLDVDFVNVQPMDGPADLRVAALARAAARLDTTAASWLKPMPPGAPLDEVGAPVG